MTAPDDAFGESSHGDETNPPPAGDPAFRTPDQPAWHAPWDPPTPPAAGGYPPPGYYPTEYPPEYPPTFPPPTGYQQPPGYGGPPYPPYPPGPQFGAPPAGYWPPSNPGDYYPPGDFRPNYQGGYGFPAGGFPPGPTRSAVNGLAIASLVASFTGLLCCIGSIVAIVLGTIALGQIKRTRKDGYGLAVAGIVIGIATLLISLIVMMFAIQSH